MKNLSRIDVFQRSLGVLNIKDDIDYPWWKHKKNISKVLVWVYTNFIISQKWCSYKIQIWLKGVRLPIRDVSSQMYDYIIKLFHKLGGYFEGSDIPTSGRKR